MDKPKDFFFNVILPVLGIGMGAYWIWLLGVTPGFTETTEYINYHVQFKAVVDELISCSEEGGLFEAQIMGQNTYFNCVQNRFIDVKGFGWNVTGVSK